MAEVARLAGESWRRISPEHRARYEELSRTDKVGSCSPGIANRAVSLPAGLLSICFSLQCQSGGISLGMQADYASSRDSYLKMHPKPPRRPKLPEPSDLKRPQSAYLFFLAEFRDNFKVFAGLFSTSDAPSLYAA